MPDPRGAGAQQVGVQRDEDVRLFHRVLRRQVLTEREAAAFACVVVAERLRLAVGEEPFILKDGEQLSVTVSIGIAMTAVAEEAHETLLKRADEALYAAKNGGRNRTVVFTDDTAPAPPQLAVAS